MSVQSSSKETTTTERALLLNELNETTQAHSENDSAMTDAECVSTSPLDQKLRLMDTCLKLIKPTSVMKYVEDPASELPALVGLECTRTGSVYLPFAGEQAQRLLDAYNDTTTEYTSIDASQVTFKNPTWSERLDMFAHRISNMFECKIPIRPRLEKLIGLRNGEKKNKLKKFSI